LPLTVGEVGLLHAVSRLAAVKQIRSEQCDLSMGSFYSTKLTRRRIPEPPLVHDACPSILTGDYLLSGILPVCAGGTPPSPLFLSDVEESVR
jgi:hypothetical protein